MDGVVEINQARAATGGVTTGDAPGYPVTISERGSYRLTSVLSVQDQTAIEVTAEGVSVDLNGFGIECSTSCTTGHGIEATSAGIHVRNGFVRGMGESGITVRQRARISDVDLSENGGAGLSAFPGCIGRRLRARNNDARGLLCPSVLVDSLAQDNGRNGLQITQGVAARNLVTGNGTQESLGFEGNGVRLSGGVAHANTIRDSTQHGIRAQQATLVLGNAITGNTFFGIFSEGFGNLGYRDNVLDDNPPGTVSCIIGTACLELGGNLCDGSTTCP